MEASEGTRGFLGGRERPGHSAGPRGYKLGGEQAPSSLPGHHRPLLRAHSSPPLPVHEKKGRAGSLHRGRDPGAALNVSPAFTPTVIPPTEALGGEGRLWHSELSIPTCCSQYPSALINSSSPVPGCPPGFCLHSPARLVFAHPSSDCPAKASTGPHSLNSPATAELGQ